MKSLLILLAVAMIALSSPTTNEDDIKDETEIAEKPEESEEEMYILDFKNEMPEKKDTDGIYVNEKDGRVYVTVSIKYPSTQGNFKITEAKMKDGKVNLKIESVPTKGEAFLQVITYRTQAISFNRKNLPEKLPEFIVPGKTFEAMDR